MRPQPDYSDRPTIIVHVEEFVNLVELVGFPLPMAETRIVVHVEGFVNLVELVGFPLPMAETRIVIRDWDAGNEADENGDLYEDTEL